MKVATGRDIYQACHAAAEAIAPGLRWALYEPDGSWSESPRDCDLIVLGGQSYSNEFKQQAGNLPAPKWAHTEDAGTDGPFYDAMREKKALITHSPGSNAPEVAEFALGLLLWQAKRLDELRQQQNKGDWNQLMLHGLSDKTVLIVGLGAIGSRIARRCKAFDMTVLGIRRSQAAVEHVDRQGVTEQLNDFLPLADYVILALPLNPATENLFDRAAFSRMKPGATLINVARGAIVETGALLEALQSGHLAQACLDVAPVEPVPAGDPLWNTHGLFLTPHVASNTPMYMPRVVELWLENLQRYVKGEPLLNRV